MYKISGVFLDSNKERHVRSIIANNMDMGEYQLILTAKEKNWVFLYITNINKVI
ncbi:hypothetical protein R4Y45_04095 [Holzapfeliella sp. He02]|uniref:Uncharacterized protein n=1 Tax=Holzapfeliella saturejae TaxID=3082953 RepID=A0ABU8SHJ8_9LACO